MRFPYQGYPVSGVGTTRIASVYRPAAMIRIIGFTGDVIAYGLLDTGADDTLFPIGFLKPLGIAIPAGSSTTITGLGGGVVKADFARVDLEFQRGKTTYRWSATVGFYAGYKTILGQSGVLEHFLASFNHRLRQATLRPSSPLPAPSLPTP